MELGSIANFLENRTILVTGATGFLAKIFVEKILRIQPNVNKLYLLVRAADSQSAIRRLHDEVIRKELFKVLKEKLGATLSSFISEKVTPVAGDIVFENLGVNDLSMKEEIWREVDVVVNVAATTKFDERYDISIGINTLGALNVLNFTKKCAKAKMLVHVSTAYVAGERAGLILESPLGMCETLNGRAGLDIDAEKTLVERTLDQLHSEQTPEKAITVVMKDLGIERSRLYGWPNTYVFTKAMGEMLLGHFRGNLPLIIIRPTIITSTYKEPFPGWVEGIRTIDSVIMAHGKGKLTFFPGDPTTIIDVVPADMVVNSMIVAMAANHANQQHDVIIYHIGSSVGNPVNYSNIQDYSLRYFTTSPWIDKEGKPVAVRVRKLTVLSTMASFHRYMAIRYLPLLKGLRLVNMAFCQCFQKAYVELNRKINQAMRLVELYKPYLFFKGSFDDMNTEKLRILARGTAADSDAFLFDPKHINWEDYFLNTHIPGAVKYIFK